MGRYQDDFRKMVIARIRSGESRTSIATSLSIPPATIKNWARNEGLNKTRNKINDKQKLQIFELLENGLTKTKIAQMLGVSRGQVTYATQDREHRNPRYHNLETKHLVLRRIMSGELEKNISEEFGIPIGTIKFWMRGLRKRGLSDEQIQEVRRRVKNGESKSKVARDLRIGENSVRNVTSDISRALAPIPENVRKDFSRRVRAGESPSVVSRELNISLTTNSKWGRRAMHEISIEEEENIKNLLKENRTVPYIAKKLGVPRPAVSKLRSTLSDRSRRRIRYTPEEKEKAIRAREAGMSYQEAADLVGAKASDVSTWFNEALAEGYAIRPPKKVSDYRDEKFAWIERDYPEYLDWHKSAMQWVKTPGVNFPQAVRAIAAFIKDYLHGNGLPANRVDFFKRGIAFPDFFETACEKNYSGAAKNNNVYKFLQWILAGHEFSDIDDDGNGIVLPIFRNPVRWVRLQGLPKPDISVRSVLPYHHVDELRSIIVGGENFSDWKVAHELNQNINERGAIQRSSDWFEVDESLINKSDPDCVWRVRNRLRDEPVLEMWSPVRWVLLLLKLQIPARTGQIRMSDSGESDTYRFVNGGFEINNGALAEGTTRSPWRQGIVRKMVSSTGGDSQVLFFNSNKTADIARRGANIGQECPWPNIPDITQNPYFWIEKLRDWQEKYNPIKKRTRWVDLPSSRELSSMSDEAKGKYLPTCFLFRTPESPGEENFPMSGSVAKSAWHSLLRRYQMLIDERGDRNADGSRIKIWNESLNGSDFTLHGLRVSLITHLIVDGGLPPEVMQRVVGHARLIMTYYYTKPSVDHIKCVVADAAARLDALKDERVVGKLASSSLEELDRNVVFNSDNWKGLIPANPNDRNPLGWLLMHDGICLAGGNTDAIDGNSRMPGCHNGGAQSKTNEKDYEAVPGGPRNCARCRWKVYEKAHGPAMVASLNNKFYHLYCRQEEALKASRDITSLKKVRADAEASGVPFLHERDLITAQRLYEGAMVRLDQLASDACALFKAIERVRALPESDHGGVKLVAQSGALDMHTIFEEVPSELLQLSVLCSDIEVYPDLDAGTAVYRRSQLLDGALEREGHPPVFMRLTEEEMLSYGNAYMKKLALQANPNNEAIGMRRIVCTIESGEVLSKALGISVCEGLPSETGYVTGSSYRRKLKPAGKK